MKLVICGDMSVTNDSLKYFAEGDAQGAFGNCIDVIKSADRSIVNLECAITDHTEGIKKIGSCLKAPEKTAQTLKDAGFTDCALSNNHIFDFGKKGLSDTIAALDKTGLIWFGIGENYEDSRRNHTITVDDITVNIINVCEHEYSYATENRIGARPFDEFETMHDIREAKKSADYVIVIYHGGKERCRYPSPRLLKACREMVRCGADVVLCQHSHCIGCYEEFEGGHILYGQGNFHFVKIMQNNPESWLEGLMAKLDITKNGIDIDFIPVVGENGKISLADSETAEKIKNELYERSKKLHNGEWKKHWSEFCNALAFAYRHYMSGYTPEDDADKTQDFSHRLDCEAHTDVWREIFPTWNMTNETD